MAKRFVVPFATSGDRSVTPDATDPGGAISYSQGWPVAYQLADTDPSYRPVGRQEMNGVFFDVTGALAEIQTLGFPEWVAVTGLVQPYAINATLRHNNINWRSLITNNSDEPGVGAGATSWVNTAAAIPGRLLRTSVYTLVAGVQNVSVDGGAPTTVGASTFTPLAAAVKIIAEAVGGGGGSGGTNTTSASQFAVTGGGSGATFGMGMYNAPVSPVAVTIAAGGLAGTVNGNGGNGGTTSLGSLLSVGGGSGSALTPATTGNLVTGGSAPTKIVTGANLWSAIGGPGLYGISLTQFIAGAGGGSAYGPGGLPGSTNGAGQTSLGIAGQSPGAGAGGSSTAPSAAGITGAKGADGQLIVREYA